MITMTPKEKAEELVEKFRHAKSHKMSDYSTIYNPTAKVCALIAVDEVINSSPARSPINDGSDAMPHFRAVKYWEQVKEEIEKL